ncbi:MAG: holo-ACP synthase [Victivallales bacterium]|nr:holo-ACP synthase [Victivallales bacterium]
MSRIIGIGTDIVEIQRLQLSIQRSGEAFMNKVYTVAEQEAVPRNPERAAEFLAGRWAAKEALAKALGTGITEECRLCEISVENLQPSRKPVISLSGNAAATAERLGVRNMHLSISHEKHYAVATVLLEGK